MVEDIDHDLWFERSVNYPPLLLWRAWTEPEQLKWWYAPRPWRTADCKIDLQASGEFSAELRGPSGEAANFLGCYLEVVPARRLVWTTSLKPGYRPAEPPKEGELRFTAFLSLDETKTGCHYKVLVKHADPGSKAAHEARGFSAGWATAFNQMLEMIAGQT